MEKPLAFDEIQLGDTWISPKRVVTESDVSSFAWLTGDFNRLHMDEEFARQTPFRRPIAHGLLGLSFVAGLGSESPLVDTVAFVGIHDWKFLKPIYFGDEVYVRTEVTAKQPRSRRYGAVQWKRQLVNQDGAVVQEGAFETLVAVPRKTPVSDSAVLRDAGRSSIESDALSEPESVSSTG